MEQVVEVARCLREDHDFRGYIHLKSIPDASPELLEKDGAAIRRSMARLAVLIDDAKQSAKRAPATAQIAMPPRRARAPRFAPAGQSTQMIVDADAASDRINLSTSANLYGAYRLKRVYYSAFSPIPDASSALPLQSPPLVREHRLYQADWLMRFYGFEHDEIVSGDKGLLELDIDPKLAWALAHRERFPVDLNRAPKELLLRVPGLGLKAVGRIIEARRLRRVHADDLARLRVPLEKVLPFVQLDGHKPGAALDSEQLAGSLRTLRAAQQTDLFD